MLKLLPQIHQQKLITSLILMLFLAQNSLCSEQTTGFFHWTRKTWDEEGNQLSSVEEIFSHNPVINQVFNVEMEKSEP